MNIEENKHYHYVNGIFGDNTDVSFMNHGYFPIDNRLWNKDITFKTSATLYLKMMSYVNDKADKLLEIGCGRGGGLSIINEYCDVNECHGIDYNESNIKFCQEHIGDNINFAQGNALDLAYPDKSFDVILNVESSHCYIDKFELFFDNVLRVLKDDGVFLYTDVFSNSKEAKEVLELIKTRFKIIHKADSTYEAYLSSMHMSNVLRDATDPAYKYFGYLFAEKTVVYRQRLAIFKQYALKKL